MAESSRNFYTVFPIEGTVNDRGVILSVEDIHFKASTMLVENTTLSAFMSDEDIPKGDAITQGFGDYVYKQQLTKAGNRLRFVFLKPKAEAEQIEQVKEPLTIYEPISWPNWLVSLYAVKAKELIQNEEGTSAGVITSNVVTATRYYDRYRLISGGTFNTEIRVEQYFSQAQLQQFVPTEPRALPVFYNVLGMSNRLECIHEDLFFSEVAVEISKVPNFGSAVEVQTWSLGSKFPRTNMTAWIPHYRRVQVTPRDGGYFYTTNWVIPPEINPEILV